MGWQNYILISERNNNIRVNGHQLSEGDNTYSIRIRQHPSNNQTACHIAHGEIFKMYDNHRIDLSILYPIRCPWGMGTHTYKHTYATYRQWHIKIRIKTYFHLQKSIAIEFKSQLFWLIMQWDWLLGHPYWFDDEWCMWHHWCCADETYDTSNYMQQIRLVTPPPSIFYTLGAFMKPSLDGQHKVISIE